MSPADDHLHARLDRIEHGQDALLAQFSAFQGRVEEWMKAQGTGLSAVSRKVEAHLQEHAAGTTKDLQEARKAPVERFGIFVAIVGSLGGLIGALATLWAVYRGTGGANGP